jgi:hypothetical protein
MSYRLHLDDLPRLGIGIAEGSSASLNRFYRRMPWWKRWAFRIVAKHLMQANSSYQVSGQMNWGIGTWDKKKDRFARADIQAPGVSLAHWILYEAGYRVSEVDVVEWHTQEEYDSSTHLHFWH